MKFARIAFGVAGLYGLLSLPPLYFLFYRIGRQDPPPITHPQFYFGFVGLALVWQIAFLMIATDPARFRPMMIPAVLEKVSYMAAVGALYVQGRMSVAQSLTALPDSLWCLLFMIAFVRTRPAGGPSRVWIPNVRIP